VLFNIHTIHTIATVGNDNRKKLFLFSFTNGKIIFKYNKSLGHIHIYVCVHLQYNTE